MSLTGSSRRFLSGSALRLGPMSAARRRAARGFTFIEFLVAALIMGVLASGVGMLLMAHWMAYNDTFWQNRVNMEARQALDDICDDIRMAGNGQDTISYPNGTAQITGLSSGVNQIAFKNAESVIPISYAIPTTNNPNNLLVRTITGSDVAVAMYITNITFDYEYRQRSQDPSQPWNYYRVPTPSANVLDDLTTIYVTVTASVPSSLTGGTSYSRTLTSAVHFRAPYNANVS
jgi:prepilin-type N-terminal cleavage/methylation domain-containing protein